MATQPIIETADCAFTNNFLTVWALDYNAYVVGDLVAFHIASDAAVVTITIPNGPNGEIPVVHVENTTAAAGGATISIWHYIATSIEAAGSLTVTPSGAEAYGSGVYVCPDGEFNSTIPIDDVNTGGNSGNQSNITTPAITATLADGSVIAFLGIDTDPILSSPAGYTDLGTAAHAQVKGHLAIRDAATTISESVPGATWTIDNDTSTTAAYVLNGAEGGGPTISIPVIMNQLRNQGIS